MQVPFFVDIAQGEAVVAVPPPGMPVAAVLAAAVSAALGSPVGARLFPPLLLASLNPPSLLPGLNSVPPSPHECCFVQSAALSSTHTELCCWCQQIPLLLSDVTLACRVSCIAAPILWHLLMTARECRCRSRWKRF